jgi:TRAP-type C4-dicarboxylate transport system permease small subunit
MTKGKKELEQFPLWRLFVNIEQCIICVTLLGMTVSVTIAVALRYLTMGNFFGLEELLAFFAVWLFYLGGAYCSSKDEHVVADILSNVIKSPNLLRIRNIAVYVFSLITLAALTFFAGRFFFWTMDVGRISSMLKIPLYFSILPMFIGFILMFLHTAGHLLQEFRASPARTADEERERI